MVVGGFSVAEWRPQRGRASPPRGACPASPPTGLRVALLSTVRLGIAFLQSASGVRRGGAYHRASCLTPGRTRVWARPSVASIPSQAPNPSPRVKHNGRACRGVFHAPQAAAWAVPARPPDAWTLSLP